MNNRLFLAISLLYLMENLPEVSEVKVEADQVKEMEKSCYEDNPKFESKNALEFSHESS